MATIPIIITIIRSTLSVQININSNYLVSINSYDQTGHNLLGLSAYSGANYFQDESGQQRLHDDLGVNTLGHAPVFSTILPDDIDEANSCCRWKNGLTNYIESGQACEQFASQYSTKIWSSDSYKSTGLGSMIYLRAQCQDDNQPVIDHCYAARES